MLPLGDPLTTPRVRDGRPFCMGTVFPPFLLHLEFSGVLGVVGAPCTDPHITSASLVPWAPPLPAVQTAWPELLHLLLVPAQDISVCPMPPSQGRPTVGTVRSANQEGPESPGEDSGSHSGAGGGGEGEPTCSCQHREGWEQGASGLLGGVPSVQRPGGLQGATAEGPFAKLDQGAVVMGKRPGPGMLD